MRRLLLLVFILALVGTASADTLIVYTAGSSDGYVSRTVANSTIDELATGNGIAAATTQATALTSIDTATTTETDKWNGMAKSFFLFNSSAVPDDATVTGVMLSLNSTQVLTTLGNTTYTVTNVFPATAGTVATGTYQLADNIKYIDPFYQNGLRRYNLTLNAAAVANVSKTSWTNYSVRLVNDVDITTDGLTWAIGNKYARIAWATAEHATADFRPFLEITYTPAGGDTTPPDSITALTNTSVSCSALFFNWTNPSDDDYGNLMVWRNNTALANLTNTTTGVSWTGLPGSTDITFSSKTCDLIGNCNASFVNMTATTEACAAPPVSGCTYTNLTGVWLLNSTPWEITIGNITWGTLQNTTEGNVSYFSCVGTPIPTATPTPTPVPNLPAPDSSDILDLVWDFWWILLAFLAVFVLVVKW